MKEAMPRYSYEIIFDSDKYPFTCGGFFNVDKVVEKIDEIMKVSEYKIKGANIVYMDHEGENIKTDYFEVKAVRERIKNLKGYGSSNMSFSI